MKVLSTILLLASFLLSSSLSAQTFFYFEELTVIPAEPAAGENVCINISGQKSTPCVETITADASVTGNEILVDLCFMDNICIQILDPWDTTLCVGSLAPGDYTISLGGCFHSGIGEQFEFSVGNPQVPVANFSQSLSEGCGLLQVEFENLSENADLFLWTFGDGNTSDQENPTHLYDQPGLYDVSLEATNSGTNLTNTYTLEEAVIVYELPEIDLGADTTITTTDNLNLNAGSGFIIYNWSTGATTSSIDIAAGDLAPGAYTYAVTVTDENNCMTSDNITVTVEMVDQTREWSASYAVLLAPNPAGEKAQLSWETGPDPIREVRLLNTRGQLLSVYAVRDHQQQLELSLDGLPDGLYYIQLTSGRRQFYRKLMKQE
jgi:PKD repeat protein